MYIVQLASHEIFMRIIYFSCFFYSQYIHAHLQCMHNKRAQTNETYMWTRHEENKKFQSTIYILFLKSNQYSVVTRKPKLTIHVSVSIIHIMLGVHVKLTAWRIHTHIHNKMFGRLFFSCFIFNARKTRVGKNSLFYVRVSSNSSLASSVIRHWLSHPFQILKWTIY